MNAPHIRLGQIGEETVANYLKRKGYSVCGRNYRKKWGEIDLIAEKGSVIHFVEVKTVSREIGSNFVSHETWLPEENVERRKLGKLLRTIEIWLLEHQYDGKWQLDVVSVWLDTKRKRGRIKVMENIIKDT